MKTKREALEMFRSMSEERLIKQREIIASSMDYRIETKDLLIEAIDSVLNKEQLTHISIVPEADIRQGEI